MGRGISHRVRETLREELGDLGENIFEKQCWDIGVPPDDLSYDYLDQLAENVFDAVRYFMGIKKAEKVKNSIRKYVILNKLNEIGTEEKGMVALVKECELHLELGYTNLALGYMKEGLEDYKKAFEVAKQSKRKDLKIQASLGIIQAYLELGESKKAQTMVDKSMSLVDGPDFKCDKAECLRYLGVINWREGDYDKASEYFKDSLIVYKEECETSGVAMVYDNLGDLYGEMEEYDRSIDYYQKSGDIYGDEKNQYQKVISLMNRGVIYSLKKEWEKAANLYEQSKELAEKHRLPNMEAWSLFNLGEAYIYTEEHDKAEAAFQESLELLKNQQDHVGEAGVRIKYGQLFLERGEYEKGDESLSAGIEILRELNIPRYLADALHELGKTKHALGDVEKARELIDESIGIYDELGLDERKERVLNDLEKLTK